MNPDGKGILARLDATDEEISLAWAHAISAALRQHRQAGVPVATWDDEKECVVLIPPGDIAIPDGEPVESVPSNTVR